MQSTRGTVCDTSANKHFQANSIFIIDAHTRAQHNY